MTGADDPQRPRAPTSWRARLHLPELPGDPEIRRRLALLRDYQRRVHRWFTISALMGLTVGGDGTHLTPEIPVDSSTTAGRPRPSARS